MSEAESSDWGKTLARYKIEREDKWRESIDVIPYIEFPPDWKVQVIPPFGGAMARFRVRLPSGDEKSVYLDFYDRLGYFGAPYWEVYPYEDDVGRCQMADVARLLEMIADRAGRGEGDSHD